MRYTDLQNWIYNDDLHRAVGQQRDKNGDAHPEVLIAGLGIAGWALVLIALWP